MALSATLGNTSPTASSSSPVVITHSRELLDVPDSEWNLATNRHLNLQGLLMLGSPPKDEVRSTAALLNVDIATVERYSSRRSMSKIFLVGETSCSHC